MNGYAVGSVCVILGTLPQYEHYVGRECTIVDGLKKWDDGEVAYVIEVQGDKGHWRISHEYLRLRKHPPSLDGWLREKMDLLLSPNHVIALELALETTREGGQ